MVNYLKYISPAIVGWKSNPIPPPKPLSKEAGVYTARGIAELHQQVSTLADQDFRIITVINTQDDNYHVVAQKGGAE